MEESLRNSGAYRVFTERDPETGEIIVYGEPRREAPTPEWGVVIGDIVHNLRSALDHMVWALTVANGNAPPAVIPKGKAGKPWRDISFPIYTDPYPTDHGGKLIPWSQSKEPQSLWGIDPSLRADFESLQPFMSRGNPGLIQLGTEDPSYAPLAILHNLWNIDKHRHLHLTVFTVGYKDLFGPPTSPQTPGGVNRLNFAPNPRGSFEGRTEFGRLSWDGGPVPTEVARRLNPSVFFDIAFEDGPPVYGGRVTQTLDGPFYEVQRILQRFEQHLA